MTRIVVVGGGIVGMACARELAKAGGTVTLLEYGKTGMQATNAAAGILAPIIEAERAGAMLALGMRALDEFPALVAELEAAAGFDVEFRPDGILKVALDDAGAEVLRERYRWQRQHGLALEWLNAESCLEAEPRLTERVVAGVFSAREGSISNQLLALALERTATHHGTEIRQGAPVIGFTTRGDRVTGVETLGETFGCDTVVLAAGARSGQLARKLHADLPVRPIRGQMIALGGTSTPIRRVVWGPDGYLVPRANGLVFAGATIEDVGFRRRTTKSGVRSLRSMAIALVPQFAAAKVHFEWAGLRPDTPDHMPMIGPLERYPNVIAATGHYRNGILLGPLTGRLVAEGILGNDWSAIPEEFAPARFGI